MNLKSGLGAFLSGAGGMQGLQNAAQQQAGMGAGMGLGGLADLLKQRVMAEQLLREKLSEPMSRGQDQSFVPRVPTPDVPMPRNDPMSMGRAPSPGMFGGNVSTTSEYRDSPSRDVEPGASGDQGYGWTSYTGEDYAKGRSPNSNDYVGYGRAKDLLDRSAPSADDLGRQQELDQLEQDINYWMSQPDSDEKMGEIQRIQRRMDELRSAQ